jgi:prophage DNA circulation protein
MLAELVRLSSKFKEDYQGMQKGQLQAVDHVVEKLKRLIAFLQGIDKTVLAMLTDLSGLSDDLMKDIEDVACNIKVHKELQAKLEEVMDTILDVSEGAQDICPTGRFAATSSFLTDIDKLYTMESEREIHMMHTDAPKQATIQERSNAPSDDLGDNVELF